MVGLLLWKIHILAVQRQVKGQDGMQRPGFSGFHLRLVAGLLLLMVGADAGIACNLPLIPAVDWSRCISAPCSRYRDRFARNTVDSLTTIRKLKEHKVECYFEKENIWTFDSKGELLLTIIRTRQGL